MPKVLIQRHLTFAFTAALAAVLLTSCSSGSTLKAVGTPVTVKVPVTVTAPAQTAAVTVTETVAGPFVTVTESAAPAADPTSTPDTDSATPTGLTVGGTGITASNTRGGATISVLTVARKKSGTGDYSDPPKNGNYVLIDVSYLCTTGTWNYNPFDWEVRDAAGRTYDTNGSYSSGYRDAALNSGTLGKSAKARGTLVFDAPTAALTLEYAPGFSGAPATWVISA